MNRWTLLATLTFALVFTGSFALMSRQDNEPDAAEVIPDLLDHLDDETRDEATDSPDTTDNESDKVVGPKEGATHSEDDTLEPIEATEAADDSRTSHPKHNLKPTAPEGSER